MQGTQIAFEFHLSFQKKQGHQLIGSFSLLAEFFRRFLWPFSFWLMNILEFSHSFSKEGRGPLEFFEISNKNSEPIWVPCIRKLNRKKILKGHLKKMLTNIWEQY